MDERLGKSYKLCSKKIIASFFEKGKANYVQKFPFRLYYQQLKLPSEKPFQIVFSAPKKKLKSAPKRNKVKRRMREVVRKNKNLIEPTLINQNKQLALFLVYNNHEIIDFDAFESKIVFILERLNQTIKEQV